jgi:small-conductance mechanosensitive channel
VYEAIKAVHVLSAFAFVLVHGTSAAVALRLRDEREPARLRALLDLSAATLGPITWAIALLMIASGIALGLIASWWSYWWIWAAVVLFIVITGVMTPLGSFRLNDVRRALGMPVQGKPSPPAVNVEQLETVLARWDPRPVSWIGGLGLAAIVLLMVLKPY